MIPQEILEIRCSEIASEAILGPVKQSHSSYMACRTPLKMALLFSTQLAIYG